jgi:hypothetical protein
MGSAPKGYLHVRVPAVDHSTGGGGHFPGCLGHRAGRMLANGGPTGCLRNPAGPGHQHRRGGRHRWLRHRLTHDGAGSRGGAAGNPAGIEAEIAQLHQGICALYSWQVGRRTRR